MFTDFLYLLRAQGMKTGLNEWNSLMDALSMNLNEASLTEFYYTARAVLVKKDSDYDKFDQAFLEYFENVTTYDRLPQEVLDWLAKAREQTPYDKDEVDARFEGLGLDEIRKMMEERLKEQHEQHHGGTKWIGTGEPPRSAIPAIVRGESVWEDLERTGAPFRWLRNETTGISGMIPSCRYASSR